MPPQYRYLQTQAPTPGQLQGSYDSLLRALERGNQAARTASRHFTRITDRILSAHERDNLLQRQSALRQDEIRMEGALRAQAAAQQQMVKRAVEARQQQARAKASAWFDSRLGSQSSPLVKGGSMLDLVSGGMSEEEFRRAIIASGRNEEQADAIVKMTKADLKYIPSESRQPLVGEAMRLFGPAGAEMVVERLSEFPADANDAATRRMSRFGGSMNMLVGGPTQRQETRDFTVRKPSATEPEWERISAALRGETPVEGRVVNEKLLAGARFDPESMMGSGYETLLKAMEDEGVKIVPTYANGQITGWDIEAPPTISPAAVGKLRDLLSTDPGAAVGMLVAPGGTISPSSARGVTNYLLRRSEGEGEPAELPLPRPEAPPGGSPPAGAPPPSALDPLAPFRTPISPQVEGGRTDRGAQAPVGRSRGIWGEVLGDEALHYLDAGSE